MGDLQDPYGATAGFSPPAAAAAGGAEEAAPTRDADALAARRRRQQREASLLFTAVASEGEGRRARLSGGDRRRACGFARGRRARAVRRAMPRW